MPQHQMLCAVIHSYAHPERDATGCRLPAGHSGPHEHLDDKGDAWEWETDFNCECETCAAGDDEDYCTTYWRKKPGLFTGLVDGQSKAPE